MRPLLAPSRIRALAQRATTPAPCVTAPLRGMAAHSNLNNASGSPAPDVLAARRQLISGGMSEEEAEACLATFVPIAHPVATKQDLEFATLKLQLWILVSGVVFGAGSDSFAAKFIGIAAKILGFKS